MTFTDAIEAIIDTKKVTRKEWNDKRHYAMMKDQILQIHKAGEDGLLLHPWIISEGDMIAEDWAVL